MLVHGKIHKFNKSFSSFWTVQVIYTSGSRLVGYSVSLEGINLVIYFYLYS